MEEGNQLTSGLKNVASAAFTVTPFLHLILTLFSSPGWLPRGSAPAGTLPIL